eukprot:353005-Chlamydomonas_euryale.AAC.8
MFHPYIARTVLQPVSRLSVCPKPWQSGGGVGVAARPAGGARLWKRGVAHAYAWLARASATTLQGVIDASAFPRPWRGSSRRFYGIHRGWSFRGGGAWEQRYGESAQCGLQAAVHSTTVHFTAVHSSWPPPEDGTPACLGALLYPPPRRPVANLLVATTFRCRFLPNFPDF